MLRRDGVVTFVTKVPTTRIQDLSAKLERVEGFEGVTPYTDFIAVNVKETYKYAFPVNAEELNIMIHFPTLEQQETMKVPLPLSATLRTSEEDDTLAMVQSNIDPSNDKESILQIADHLKFSAEKYEKDRIPDSERRRSDSQMSQRSQGHEYMQHPQHPHQSSSSMRPQHQPHQQQQQQMEPLAPRRSRGRPRGSNGPQRNQPIAPHRVGGGARTLQPRSQAPPARNGGA